MKMAFDQQKAESSDEDNQFEDTIIDLPPTWVGSFGAFQPVEHQEDSVDIRQSIGIINYGQSNLDWVEVEEKEDEPKEEDWEEEEEEQEEEEEAKEQEEEEEEEEDWEEEEEEQVEEEEVKDEQDITCAGVLEDQLA